MHALNFIALAKSALLARMLGAQGLVQRRRMGISPQNRANALTSARVFRLGQEPLGELQLDVAHVVATGTSS